MRSFIFTLLAFLLFGLTFSAGCFFNERRSNSTEFALLDQAYDILINHALETPPKDPALEYGMIRGMLQSYGDPHTIFVEPPQHELQSNALEGKYGGIGARYEKVENDYWILFPYPDSPASDAGIIDGDQLLMIDDLEVTAEITLDDIQSAIRGKVGTKLNLTINRESQFDPIVVTITREEIPLPTVEWRLDSDEPRVGILKVNLISADTSDEIIKAVDDLQNRGAKYFVLDLRDNPGGLLVEGVELARLFLKKGIVMQQQYRGKAVETFKVEKPGPLSDIPLAVLINKGSASAAEIIAGTLKANNRAIIIGTSTYGKDTVQLVFDLKDGSSLRVTAAKWWIPGLETPIGENGIEPNIMVEGLPDSTSNEQALQTAIHTLLGIK